MNLIVDIGNTLIKLFLFSNNEITHCQNFKSTNDIPIQKISEQNQQLQYAIVSSVAELPKTFINEIKKYTSKLIILNSNTQLPIKNLYKTPETLGKDRIAGIVGAYNIFPKQNVLAIDAGTAMTFDFINEKEEYIGGNISPGLNMRYRALNSFTKNLPLLKQQEEFKLIGSSTFDAIVSGVQNGIIFEIETYIERLTKAHTHLKVILTGGDCFFFARKLKNRIFAKPYLVAIGLNRILNDNIENT